MSVVGMMSLQQQQLLRACQVSPRVTGPPHIEEQLEGTGNAAAAVATVITLCLPVIGSVGGLVCEKTGRQTDMH